MQLVEAECEQRVPAAQRGRHGATNKTALPLPIGAAPRDGFDVIVVDKDPVAGVAAADNA